MPIPGKINDSFDWGKWAWKGVKTALVAGGVYMLASPDLQPALLGIVPPQFQALAIIALPTLITAARNYLKHAGGSL